MNRRTQSILDWCKKNRPDLEYHVVPQGRQTDDAFQLLLSVGFEAGRKFQADNPKTELDNPNVYDPAFVAVPSKPKKVKSA